MSALERVQVTWYPNLQCTWSHDGPVASLLVTLTEPSTAHANFERLWISLQTKLVIVNLGTGDARHQIALPSGLFLRKDPVSVLGGFRTKLLKKVPAVQLIEVSTLERVQLQRDKCNSAGTTKLAVRLREVSALECPLWKSWLYIFLYNNSSILFCIYSIWMFMLIVISYYQVITPLPLPPPSKK